MKDSNAFTFHNVSISTTLIRREVCRKILYIPQCIYFYENAVISKALSLTLHSTMYLFLPEPYVADRQIQKSLHSTMYLFLQIRLLPALQTFPFTFHNVSISTEAGANITGNLISLHSTMYLFLQLSQICMPIIEKAFTFHNVSISTRPQSIPAVGTFRLYIPQCIYFYKVWPFFVHITELFTFHNVSISTSSISIIHLYRSDFTFHNVSISTPSFTLLANKLKDLYIPQCIYFYRYGLFAYC